MCSINSYKFDQWSLDAKPCETTPFLGPIFTFHLNQWRLRMITSLPAPVFESSWSVHFFSSAPSRSKPQIQGQKPRRWTPWKATSIATSLQLPDRSVSLPAFRFHIFHQETQFLHAIFESLQGHIARALGRRHPSCLEVAKCPCFLPENTDSRLCWNCWSVFPNTLNFTKPSSLDR